MPKTYILDKVLSAGVEHRLPPTVGYKIFAIGTDDTAEAYIEIGGKSTGKIIQDIAPLHTTETNKLGLVQLDTLYYYVPPKETLIFRGTTDKKARIKGQIIEYLAGEVPALEDVARFDVQHKKHIKTLAGYIELATDEKWAKERELTVYEVTPLTTEILNFNNVAMVKFTNVTVKEGDVAIIPKIDGDPVVGDVKEVPYMGYDALSLPYPPADTTEELPFSLKDLPIKVLGDQTFSLIARNESGTDLAPPAGTKIRIDFRCLVEYEKKA